MFNLTAHMVVKNEIMFCGYAIESVINNVDRMIVIDTGSNDKTIELLNHLYKKYNNLEIMLRNDKIDGSKWVSGLNEKDVTTYSVTDARNDMMKLTKTDWTLTIDGDEVYNEKSIETVNKAVNSNLENKLICKVHIKWFCKDIFTIDTKPYDYTCRIFKNNIGLEIRNPFPREYHYLNNKPVNPNDEKIVIQMSNKVWIHHYEQIKSPNRRITGNLEEYNDIQPSVFYKSYTREYFEDRGLKKYIYV